MIIINIVNTIISVAFGSFIVTIVVVAIGVIINNSAIIVIIIIIPNGNDNLISWTLAELCSRYIPLHHRSTCDVNYCIYERCFSPPPPQPTYTQ